MKIFDTNIWIAAYIPSDSTHNLAKDILEKYDDTIYLTQGIVAEIITVLKNKKHLAGAKRFVKMVYNNADFVILSNDKYYQDTIDYFLSSNDTKLSFVDMSLVVLSQKYQVETFEKALKAAIA